MAVGYFFDEIPGEPSAAILELPAGEEEDLTARYETKLLVRAYYGITDPLLRSQVCELAKALAPSA